MAQVVGAFIDFLNNQYTKLSTNRYKVLFEQSVYNSFLVDKNYKILRFNKKGTEAAKSYFQHGLKIGDSITNFISAEDAKIFKVNIDRCFSGKILDFERIIAFPNTQPAWFHIIYNPLYDKRNNVCAVVFNIKEVTERKSAELKIVQTKFDAEESAMARKQFLANVSHEMRNSLNAVTGMTNILLKRNPTLEQVPLLKTLKFSSEHLLGIVNEVLDFSKLEAGKTELASQVFDLKALVDNIVNTFRPMAEEKELELLCSFDDMIPENITGDSLKISQVLTNLIGNALKFTLKGKIEVHVKWLGENDINHIISFSVSDTGIGISEKHLDKIFENFTQANKDTSYKFGGSGLGLAISKKLLELMGSQINVQSAPGKGSVFYFDLFIPKAEKPSEKKETEASKTSAEDNDELKILLVEDNEINQFVALELLKEWNIHPDVAENGQEALAKVRIKAYDLILMDIYMPVMDGFSATAAIRNGDLEHYKKIPIIALSADTIGDIRVRGEAVGITDFITKPFNSEELYKKIISHTYKKGQRISAFSKKENKQKLCATILDLCNNDPENIKILREKLISYLEKLPTDFDEALANRDISKMRSIKHTFKPTAEYFQLQSVYQLLEEGTNKLKEFNTDDILFQHISLRFNEVCQNAIEELVDGFMEISS